MILLKLAHKALRLCSDTILGLRIRGWALVFQLEQIVGTSVMTANMLMALYLEGLLAGVSLFVQN